MPEFAEWVENTMASESNPTRRGRFVRVVRRTGRTNPGVWWELTDGHGDFWEVRPEHCCTAGVTRLWPCLHCDEMFDLRGSGSACWCSPECMKAYHSQQAPSCEVAVPADNLLGPTRDGPDA